MPIRSRATSGTEAGVETPAGGGESNLGAVAGAYFDELPIAQVRPNERQPRQVFDEEAMAELVHSITEVGLLQPIVVRDAGDGYELIMGERRWRATQAAGLATIPAIIRETGDADLLRDALLENLHRSELNPLEEAAAYQQLLDEIRAGGFLDTGGGVRKDLTQAEFEELEGVIDRFDPAPPPAPKRRRP